MLFDLQQILALPASPPSWLRFALEHNLRQIAAEHKVQRYFLRAVRQILAADTAWYVALPETGDKPIWDGPDRPCNMELVREFAAQREPELPTNLLLAPVRVHGRLNAVVSAEKADGSFAMGSGHELNGLCSLLAQEQMTREEERVDDVLLDIKDEILRDLRPRDLVYRILHGLRRLVDYDHSSALLIFQPAGRALRVEAEQIAWLRAEGSRAIGRELPISRQLADELRRKGERIVARRKGRIDEAASVILEPEGELAEVLAYAAEGGAPTPTSALCAPLVKSGRLLGALRISAVARSPFNAWDARVVSTFLPAAVSAIQDAHDRVALEHQALSAEQRAYLVNVAKFVAHDINNSLGAALPLAQEMVAELDRGEPKLDVWREDLKTIIDSIEKCSGVFDRLLRQEQDPQTGDPSGDLNRAIRTQWTFLEPRFTRRRATCERHLDRDLPRVGMFQGDLGHVVLNLMVNALDAMPGEGGEVHVRTFLDEQRAGEDGGVPVTLEVRDNGVGIPDDRLDRVFDAFFSTKGGTGMGLPLVRRMVDQVGGTVDIESSPDAGTVVTVRLPRVGPRQASTARVEMIR